MSAFFPYDFDNRFAPIWWPLGARPGKDGVTLTDSGLLEATFGRKRLQTPMDNVEGAHITRDYRWWTSVGIRLSFADDGLTFGTNSKAGVCVHFHGRVPAVMGRNDHSALTVTVEDLDGLVGCLSSGVVPPDR
jgi:hypothetical protein